MAIIARASPTLDVAQSEDTLRQLVNSDLLRVVVIVALAFR